MKPKKIAKHIQKNPRYQAMTLLTRVEGEQAYSNLLVNQVIEENQWSPEDAGLFTELVYGTLSRKITLEYYLRSFLKPGQSVEDWVFQLLLISLYQLEYLDRVPAYGIINDAVDIGKAKGHGGIGKFINGVLRNVQRQGVPDTSLISDELQRMSIELSLPKWLLKRLIASIGKEETVALGLSLFEPSKVSARVNTEVMTRDQALTALKEEGFDVEPSAISPVGIVGKKGFLAGSRLFETGALTIQDESSMLVAPSLRLETNHQVLDVCAAPGGKTTHIATYIDAHQGQVHALDIYEHKTKLIKENAKRLQVEQKVTTHISDARELEQVFPSRDTKFDRILVDAPCSGFGLMRRKPDIKYSKNPKDFEKLPELQYEILEAAAKKIKQWGIIVYSTCTILEEENQQVIERFLANHPDFETIDVLGSQMIPKAVKNQYVSLYPHQYMTDGFFICCLKQKG